MNYTLIVFCCFASSTVYVQSIQRFIVIFKTFSLAYIFGSVLVISHHYSIFPTDNLDRGASIQRSTLKGHGNEPVFSMFWHKSRWPRSLTLLFKLLILGDIRI